MKEHVKEKIKIVFGNINSLRVMENSSYKSSAVFTNSVRTARKTQHFTITKINWLRLSTGITPVYIDNDNEARKYPTRRYRLLKQIIVHTVITRP
jgi:hypothetical protein